MSQPTTNPMTEPGLRPEIWGGIECTLNRVRDQFNDQCAMNGHDGRIEQDLQRFAALGIKTLRYPVLWEKTAGLEGDDFNWENADRALGEMRRLGIRPIIGLLHHGSGPQSTSLVDPEFAEKFATYAVEVAKRYPWVTHYTPVNEPLTTARFSALYGIWYPHARDDVSFGKALYNQLKGTVLAMQAIRNVNPEAKLVQTDDLGRAQASPLVKYQAEFENHRRWLTFDLLCGHVDKDHALFSYLTEMCRLTKKELRFFTDNVCAPDIIGINHYPLSNRFLDEKKELYPESLHAFNGRDHYADVGAVDSGRATPPSPVDIYRDCWDRYRKPFVISEVHIGSWRESQLRWLNEAWEAACELRASGVEILAITAWSLLGSYDWITLCTGDTCKQHYESGVFDVRTETPRPTALAKMIGSFSTGEDSRHPLIDRPGYWHEPLRVLFARPENGSPQTHGTKARRSVLITGATGTLGCAFAKICELRGIDYRLVSRAEMDIASLEDVERVLEDLNPWSVINAAGYVRIDAAEADPERCYRENALGPQNLALACANRKIQLLTFSSEMVFDGLRDKPYFESDPVSPINVYGNSKAAAEKLILETYDQALVVRTSSFFGPWDKHNFLYHALERLRSGQTTDAVEDIFISPTYLPDLVNTCLELLIDGEKGIVHLTNEGSISWAGLARLAAQIGGLNESLVIGQCRNDSRFAAPRPAYGVLRSERMNGFMPHLQRSLENYMQVTSRGEMI